MTTTTHEPEKTDTGNVRIILQKTIAKAHVDYANGRINAEEAYHMLLTTARLIENGILGEGCTQASMLILVATITDAIKAAEETIEEQARIIKSLTIPAVKELHREMTEGMEE